MEKIHDLIPVNIDKEIFTKVTLSLVKNRNSTNPNTLYKDETSFLYNGKCHGNCGEIINQKEEFIELNSKYISGSKYYIKATVDKHLSYFTYDKYHDNILAEKVNYFEKYRD